MKQEEIAQTRNEMIFEKSLKSVLNSKRYDFVW